MPGVEVAVCAGGRATQLHDVPPAPDVGVSMDFETFVNVGCGCRNAARAIAEGRIRLDGDQEMGRRIVDSMNVMLDLEETVPSYSEEIAWID